MVGHWADEATTDLIRFVARRIERTPFLMIVSCRDVTISRWPVVSVCLHAGHVAYSSPGGRPSPMLDGHVLDPADVHRRTAGNPFFVSQILDQPDAPLPESVRDAVIARTAGLTAEERHSIELLACAPNGVSSALLAALGLSAGTVGALAATGLLDPSGRRVAFRHESPGRPCWVRSRSVQSALHATMIDALERIGFQQACSPTAGRRARRRADRALRDRSNDWSPDGHTPGPVAPASSPSRTSRTRRPADLLGPLRRAVPHRPARRRDRRP